MEFKHISVLLNETIEGLNIKKDGIYLDCTLGGGGHSLEIVKRLESGVLVGIDQDMDAIKKATQVLDEYKERVRIVKSNFSNFDKVLDELNIEKIDGALLDLGVSSFQFDEGERGFSYHQDSALDMRMDQESDFSAYNIVNEYDVTDLSNIIFKYGEERWAKRIAEFIVEARIAKPIDTTFELVEIIKNAIPKKAREDKHPAKKTFQALRIEVNKELEIIEDTIKNLVSRINVGGRLAIITFHSLEDKIVKDTFKYLETDCICDRSAPICTCNKVREIKIITRKPIVASDEELEHNNRARSAKLRVAEKV